MDEEDIEREYEEKIKAADKNFIGNLNKGIKSNVAERQYKKELESAWEEYQDKCEKFFAVEKKKKKVPEKNEEDKEKQEESKKEEEILKNFEVKKRNRDLSFKDKQKLKWARRSFKIGRSFNNFFYWNLHPKIINYYFKIKKSIKRTFIFVIRLIKRFFSSSKDFFFGVVKGLKNRILKIYSKISSKIKKIKEKLSSKKKKKKEKEGKEGEGEKSDIEKAEEKVMSKS